ncbi:hypothetical protein Pint_29705 [Pistacia integerrima]|uniref:Uncharacterized protein n=1 Tax=Pistacia integerrima TaxID=434235 RepID=A0ACC0X2Q6_9ROSI|nr:hypothetical protein Pint_29705 [Pistacia integerrima]
MPAEMSETKNIHQLHHLFQIRNKLWILSVSPISVATCGAIKLDPSSSKSINQEYRISIGFTTSRCLKNDLPFSLLSFVANHELSLQEQHYNPWLSLENKACNGVSSFMFN